MSEVFILTLYNRLQQAGKLETNSHTTKCLAYLTGQCGRPYATIHWAVPNQGRGLLQLHQLRQQVCRCAVAAQTQLP
jgi:hypothetical protein